MENNEVWNRVGNVTSCLPAGRRRGLIKVPQAYKAFIFDAVEKNKSYQHVAKEEQIQLAQQSRILVFSATYRTR